jgi:outer membrane protein
MNITKKFWIALLLGGLTCSAWAQPKIGVIDMTRVFENFFKTKAANAAMKEYVGELDKEQQALLEELKKLNDDYKKAVDEANNQAISAEERDKAKKVAEGKFKDAQAKQTEIEQFNRSADARVREKRRQTFEKLVEEIRTVVTSHAKAGGFTLVLDSAAESGRGTAVVLYTNGENDLTSAVLTQLNNTAPAEKISDDKKLK